MCSTSQATLQSWWCQTLMQSRRWGTLLTNPHQQQRVLSAATPVSSGMQLPCSSSQQKDHAHDFAVCLPSSGGSDQLPCMPSLLTAPCISRQPHVPSCSCSLHNPLPSPASTPADHLLHAA
jgi:hypothetical protein